MRATVPTNVVDNTYEVMPQGFYDGDISGAEIRDPNDDGSWLLLRLDFEGITPKEGTGDPGRTSFNGDITIKTDGVSATEVSDFSDRDLPFGIRRAGGLIAGLAEALGVTSREGGQVSVEVDAVIDALTAGQFEGERVGFEVSHYTPKNNPDKTYEQFNRFGPAS